MPSAVQYKSHTYRNTLDREIYQGYDCHDFDDCVVPNGLFREDVRGIRDF